MPKKTVCQGGDKHLCENNKCKMCYESSFASTKRAKYWSTRNDKTPRECLKKSGKRYWFHCTDCDHHFDVKLFNITINNTWCPYCKSARLCEDDDCNFCYNKSAASCEYSLYWSDDRNENPPRFYCKASEYVGIFICPECNNEYKTELFNAYRGVGCNNCKDKTAKMILDWLQIYYNFKKEKKFPWCNNSKTGRSRKSYPFDFYLKDLNIIIELDGRQHFQQVRNWRSPEETYKIDLYKMQCALDHDISVIRLVQEEVLEGKVDWKTELKENIDWCLENPATIVFIEKSQLNLYKQHYDDIDTYLFLEQSIELSTEHSTELNSDQSSDLEVESVTEEDLKFDIES